MDSTVLYPYLLLSVNKDINFSRYRTTIDYVQQNVLQQRLTESQRPQVVYAEGKKLHTRSKREKATITQILPKIQYIHAPSLPLH